MTFDEYNTDENFDKKDSSLDELVKLGVAEGKTSDEIKNSLSPKWQKSKKIGEFDNYVSKYSKKEEKKPGIEDAVGIKALQSINAKPEAPKSNPPEKTAEEKVVKNVVEEEKPEEKKTEVPKAKTDTLTRTEKSYITKQDELADNALNTVLNDVEDRSSYNWEQQYETGKKAGEAYNRIDDKLVAQLPTFLFKRFSNGEFGDPKSSDAKLRFAHFLLNGVQSKLKNASNAFMVTAGKSPLFSDTMSDYEKYQQTNFAKGLENRWRKYEAETQNAIDMVAKETDNEQGARLAAEDITKDKKLNTRFNMMTTREKADLINIKMEIGKLVGKMDLSEIADFMTGEAISGDLTKDEAVAIGVAQLVKKTPELLKQIPEGKYKDMILGLFGGGDVDTIIASLGGAGGDGGVIDTVIDTVTDRGNTYEGEDTKKGNGKDKILGVGNVNMSDKTMKSYYALNEKKPAGIKTDLPGKDIIVQTINDFPDKGVVGVIEKSGVSKSINKQFSEIDDLASQATKDFKNDGDLKKYQNRMKELYDYRNELQSVYKNFGKAPIPGNSIQSDYDKAFSNKESKFRDKYSK